MVITYDTVQYTFKLREYPINITTEFRNGRYLNAGNKIAVSLAKDQCWVVGWHSFSSLIIGRLILVTGLLKTPFEAIVCDETTQDENFLHLVCYVESYDMEGII